MSADESRLLAAILSISELPFLAVVQRRADLSDKAMADATLGLIAAGMIMRCSAPYGTLLYPTLRGISLP